jgi:hypothetical protein
MLQSRSAGPRERLESALSRRSRAFRRRTGIHPKPTPGGVPSVISSTWRRRASTVIWRTTEVTIKPLSQDDEAFAWEQDEVRLHLELVGGSLSPIFRSAGKPGRIRDRRRDPYRVRAFRVVWPLDIADTITGPPSPDILTERRESPEVAHRSGSRVSVILAEPVSSVPFA